MQNTTTSKEKPDKLIENFMIAGISQKKLIKEFKDDIDFSKKMTPTVLFSMFDDHVEMEKYIQFIYPKMIDLEPNAVTPSFHSFLTTDVKGNQTFSHCLTFYEELSHYQILHDFNFKGPLLEMQRKKEKVKKVKLEEKAKKGG